MPALPRWRVYVDDNFHPQDESSRICRGAFTSLDDAIALCIAITARSVAEHAGTPDGYLLFGEDAWVSPSPDPVELEAMLVRHPDWPRAAFARGYYSSRLHAAILQEPQV